MSRPLSPYHAFGPGWIVADAQNTIRGVAGLDAFHRGKPGIPIHVFLVLRQAENASEIRRPEDEVEVAKRFILHASALVHALNWNSEITSETEAQIIADECSPEETNGMLYAVATAANVLREIGQSAQAKANKLEKRGAERWAVWQASEKTLDDRIELWRPFLPTWKRADRWVRAETGDWSLDLPGGGDGWVNETWPTILRLFAEVTIAEWKAKRPAVPLAVHMEVLEPALRVGKQLDIFDGSVRVTRRLRGGTTEVATIGAKPESWKPPATVSADWFSYIGDGLKLLSKPYSQRLIDLLVTTVHNQHASGASYSNIVPFGTMEELKAAIGYKQGSNDELEQLLATGESTRWSSPYAEGRGLWHIDGTAKKGRARSVVISVNPLLLPTFLQKIMDGTVSGDLPLTLQKRLVPILQGDPPLPAKRDLQGAAWTMSRLLVAEMVRGAEQVTRYGGIVIDDALLEGLARRAGLSENVGRGMLHLWLDGDGTAPPIIEKTAQGRFVLHGENQRPARDFIAELGRRIMTGKRGGLNAAEKRKRIR